ncbi:MAG: putative HTH-type transcriptional regulator [Pseudonocardiales bacterium]|nr:putative HTH-type transcriptional regulator [Pseudonocardiales bacterium]
MADRGVAGATVRAIAERSGVSPSLVLHHFGSKQGAIEEVSSWVVRLMREETLAVDKRPAPTDDDPSSGHESRLAVVGRLLVDVPNLGGYLRRMLLDAQPEGLTWFREAVQATATDIRDREVRGMARQSADIQAEAAMLLVLTFAPLLLQPLLEHAIDIDLSEETGRARWRAAQLELLTSALYPASPAT